MATPVLSDLRSAFPNVHITAMGKNPSCELLSKERVVDEVFCFSELKIFGRRNERRDIIAQLRRGKYDLGIVLPRSFSSAWYFWLGRMKRRVGYRGRGRGFLLTDRVSLPMGIDQQHLVITYKMLLNPLGIPVSDTKPRIILSGEEILQARELLTRLAILPEHILVGIHPGATYGSAKRWLPERFREVTKRLLKHEKIRIIYFGDIASLSLIEEICSGLPAAVINLAGLTSLRELAALLQISHLFLTNDSGPMHIAAALGIPIVALFGATCETITGPYHAKAAVINKRPPCSPCFQRKCPTDFRCMKEIEVTEVYEQILRLLKINYHV